MSTKVGWDVVRAETAGKETKKVLVSDCLMIDSKMFFVPIKR